MTSTMTGLLNICQPHPVKRLSLLILDMPHFWKIHLTAARLIHGRHGLPVVHHQTSTILTSVEEISCQAFILLRDQGSSCSYLNITLLHCRFEIVGAGGISFISAQDPECLCLTTGLWRDYLMNLCFTAAVSEKSPGSKSGCECPPSTGPNGHFHFKVTWKLIITPWL